MSYLGISPDVVNIEEKSAEVIVVAGRAVTGRNKAEDSRAMKDRTLSCSKCCKDPDLSGSLTISGTEKPSNKDD